MANPIKTDSSTPALPDGPGGTCLISGEVVRLRIIEIDNGLTPELAVTAISPSLLRASPKGWGATIRLFPDGVSKRPLGITVVPFLFIEVYKFPAGDERTYSSFFSVLQAGKSRQDNNSKTNNLK
jgi:hypothetical protein